MTNGRLLIDRKLLEWEWWDDPVMVKVWVYMLIKASWKGSRYKGCEVPRGSFVGGRNKCSLDLGISVQTFRSCVNRLKSTNEITSKSTSRFTVYTIVNYDKYQDIKAAAPSKTPNKLTSNQPATNQQLTTVESSNKVIKNIYMSSSLGKKKKDHSSHFLGAYKLYPRHEGRADAWKAWNQMKVEETPETLRTVLDGIKAYALSVSGTDKQYIKLMAGWLRGKRWEDEKLRVRAQAFAGGPRVVAE